MKKFFPLTFVLSVFISLQVSGQTVADSVGLKHIVSNYTAALGPQSRLYNGPEYESYNSNIKGNAYVFDINTFSPGTVKYDGIEYNAPLMYDINKDVVVVLLYDTTSKFVLLSNYVTDFSLLNHHFIHIKDDSLKTSKRIAPGFYDQLYAGKNAEVLAKRTKALQAQNVGNDIQNYFDADKSYFIKKGNNYYSFSGQSALLSILKDKKDELEQYIKTNKIKYRDNPEQAMVSITSYYDHLTN